MNKEIINGNWYFDINEEANWIAASYQKDAPTSLEDVAPDWGYGDGGETLQEACINVLNRIWHGEYIDHAINAAYAMVECGLLPKNVMIDPTHAILDGKWWSARYDCYSKFGCGLQDPVNWDIFRIRELHLSEEGEKMAQQICENAKKETEHMEDSIEAWQNSWTDGIL